MDNIKKLHSVHKYYPNTPRRFGKTTYCYDSLLRASQTGAYRTLCYLTSTQKATVDAFDKFLLFLDGEKEDHKVLNRTEVLLNNCKITFKSSKMEDKNYGFDGYVEDSFEENLLSVAFVDIAFNKIIRFNQ